MPLFSDPNTRVVLSLNFFSWRGAAEEYAKECGAELHYLDEGHMRLHTRRADEITAIYKSFLGKLELDGRG